MDSKRKNEAITRMQLMGLYKPMIKDFKDKGTLYYSERTMLGGILYWISNEPVWQEAIRNFEKNNDVLVYHATHEYTAIGEMLDLFYVNSEEEEWESFKEDIREKDHGNAFTTCIHTVNLTYPELSEFGYACFREQAGGLVRE